MSELIQFLRDLMSSGQSGLVILVLVVIITGSLFVIWLQKQSLSRIELNMKSAESARKQLQDTIEKQYEFVVKTNDELRKELDRYKSNQIEFEDNVKKSLQIGFDELKTTLTKMTFSEIVEQIPENLKKDLQKETAEAIESAIDNLIVRIKESKTAERIENEIFNRKDLEKIVNEVIDNAVNRFVHDFENDRYGTDAQTSKFVRLVAKAIFMATSPYVTGDPSYYHHYRDLEIEFERMMDGYPYNRHNDHYPYSPILLLPVTQRTVELLVEQMRKSKSRF